MLTYSSKRGQPRRVEAVEFSIIGDEEVVDISVAEITETTIYFRGMPHVGGINDHRMGTVDRRLNCGTCGKDVRLCSGHQGHIKLAFPCYHIGYVETILKILRSVCFFCSRLCFTANDLDPSIQGKARLPYVYNFARNKKKCMHCGACKPNYVRNGLGIKIEWDSDSFINDEEREYCNNPFTALTARSILQNVPDSDYELMGLNSKRSHPKHCVIQYLSVPPPVARPAIMASEGSRARGQDDLTHKLQDINKKNVEVRDALQAENFDIYSNNSISTDTLEKINKLQFEVYTYINNSIRGQKQSTQRSGAPTKSVTDRLKGKEGRIRGNLMGKRVDFSARSVITPDAAMDVDQVGVPETLALVLTIPEKVTPSNIYQLHQRVSNGAKRLDGAETVITSNGTVIQLEFCQTRSQLRLQYGWTVERYLQDEDIVIFNRQPSLHKMGMMGHRVKIMDGRTFRLNLCCANPYNADFDGDEMNMHVPQSACARNEVAGIMMVPQQIISPQANKPVMGIVQDSLLGSHLLTGVGILLNKEKVMDLVSCIKYPIKKTIPLPKPIILRPQEMWTGVQVFSLLFPESLTMVKGNINKCNHKTLYIRKGEMLLGRMTKSLLGTSAGGIIDIMYRDFGSSITVNFMADVQRLVNRWLLSRAFSVGISDCVLNEKGQTQVNSTLVNTINSVDELIREASGEVDGEHLESTIIQMLSKLLMQTGSIVQENMNELNAIRTMVNAGSKGNPINLSQICGCVGQQSVEGRRVHSERSSRTLNHFPKNDKSVNGNGLVQNSYALGLHPYEYFFHAMGGREGLVDTAVKTATTGYIQRRQIKAMEDNRCHYDGTVRNAESMIVQFKYGGDGFDASKLEKFDFPALTMTEQKLQEWFIEDNELLEQHEEMTIVKDLLKKIRHDRLDPVSKTIPVWVTLPVNIDRMIKFHAFTKEQNIVSVEDILKIQEEILKDIDSVIINAVFRFNLSSAHIRRMRITKRELVNIKNVIIEKMKMGKVAAGEMVGAIAAQSIGEPCTQMSACYYTSVLVAIDGKAETKTIGSLIDSYLPEIKTNDQHDVMEVKNLKCTGISPTESVQWANVTHVSRHPANGDMLTVRTEHGRELKMTASHSFLVRQKNRVVATPGYTLKIGDCLPIVKDMPSNDGILPISPVCLNKHTGRFIGAVVAEGTVNNATVTFDNSEHVWLIEIVKSFGQHTSMNTSAKRYVSQGSLGTKPMMKASVYNKEFAQWMAEHFGKTSFNKTLPAWILDAPKDFVTGLLQTYFDGDGNVQTEKRHHRLCCHSVSEELITMLSLCLARFGIPTYVGKEDYKTPAGNPGVINRLTIPMCFAAKFQEHIGFSIDYKVERLKYVVIEQEKEMMRGFQAYIPGMNEVLEEIREYIPPGGNKNSFETLLRKELRRIQRKPGITPKMLMRIRDHAENFKAPEYLLQELDYAIHSDVWWDPIISIEIEKDSKEMVYDFTVNQNLQSFMLSNGVFVHNTLNTFHYAGVSNKNVSLGIPRLKEILDNSKHIKTPLNTLHLRKPFCYNKKLVQHIANTIPITKLNDIVSSVELVQEVNPEDEKIQEINELYDPIPDDCSTWIARVLLNKAIMNKRGVTPPLLRRILKWSTGNKVHIISSEVNSIEWILLVRFLDVQTMLEDCPFREAERILIQRTFKALLESVIIGGHPKIHNANMREMDCWDEETLSQKTEYVIDTSGTSLASFKCIPCVDWNRSTTNDINEVIDLLGIEATVELLFRQINEVISFDGTYVDPRHIMMIADTMTYRGYVMPLSRHGLNRTDTGPLVRCSFEETVEILYEAALFNEVDMGKGVTQNIMTGQTPKIGTGCFDIQLPVKNFTLNKKKKIAKSVTKTRPADEVTIGSTIEYLDPNMWNWKSVPEPDLLETPFQVIEPMNTEEHIFSTKDCELPYETISQQDNTEEINDITHKNTDDSCPFKPTSPSMLRKK